MAQENVQQNSADWRDEWLGYLTKEAPEDNPEATLYSLIKHRRANGDDPDAILDTIESELARHRP